MTYTTINREADDGAKFYTYTKDSGEYFEVPCVLDGEGNVDTTATQTKMDEYVAAHDATPQEIKDSWTE